MQSFKVWRQHSCKVCKSTNLKEIKPDRLQCFSDSNIDVLPKLEGGGSKFLVGSKYFSRGVQKIFGWCVGV